MSFFVRKDLRWLECRDPSPAAAIAATLRRHALATMVLCAVIVVFYAADVATGFRTSSQVNGIVSGLNVSQPVTIARDARGVPHITAADVPDLFFAQGFAEASDRLFQMDLTRRYAYGRLAEIFGERALDIDKTMRAADIAGIAHRQWLATDRETKRYLEAFSAGVNAAQARQPLPVEFRILLYRPARWSAEDSVAVSVVAALELSDAWNDVRTRDERWRELGRRCYDVLFPLSDPRYDVTIDGNRMRDESPRSDATRCASSTVAVSVRKPRIGSNAWAAGASRSRDGNALIANDPHADVTIPGIWYLVDVRAPGLHAAGAILPGLPGVALGHNERIAWAATNAQAATTAVYRGRPPQNARRISERFDVRFGPVRRQTYLRTATEFSIDGDALPTFVRWPVYWQRATSIRSIIALDRATDINAALRILARYTGAPENFLIADDRGRIAYHLAGTIPADPAWGRYVHPASDLDKPAHLISFAELPHRDASTRSILVSANNRMYGAAYRYRLSAAFEAPYRAYRIASLLHERASYSVEYFREMQLDTFSPLDLEIAREVLRRDPRLRDMLARWNGRYDPDSSAASFVHDLRLAFEGSGESQAALLLNLRGSRESYEGASAFDPFLAAAHPAPWGSYGAVTVAHPLSMLWYGMMSGTTLPGSGDEYTIHLQEPGFAQGFRAVWDAGNWDAGGISIPTGESGEPASSHYDDGAPAWIRGDLAPLPFSHDAVERATVSTLRLTD